MARPFSQKNPVVYRILELENGAFVMSKRVPAYRHHKPTGQAVVTLNGKDFYLGNWKSAKSREEYNRLVGEWLASGRMLPTASADGDFGIAELCIRYLRFAKEYYVKDGKRTGEVHVVKNALGILKDYYGRTLAKDFGPLSLEALQLRLVNEKYSRPTINHYVGRIRRVFRWGVAKELVPPSVLYGLQAVPGLRSGRTAARETIPVGPVDDAVVDATLPHLPAIVADMIRFNGLPAAGLGKCARCVPAISTRRRKCGSTSRPRTKRNTAGAVETC